nr:TPA: Acid sphingomyelinase-like phosphodiesterase 3b [Neospora caninum Liverpool]
MQDLDACPLLSFSSILRLSLLFLSFSPLASSSSSRFPGKPFRIAWISDLHLDPLYSPDAHIKDCCRLSPSSPASPSSPPPPVSPSSPPPPVSPSSPPPPVSPSSPPPPSSPSSPSSSPPPSSPSSPSSSPPPSPSSLAAFVSARASRERSGESPKLGKDRASLLRGNAQRADAGEASRAFPEQREKMRGEQSGWSGEETNPNIGRAGCDSSPLLFQLLLDSVEEEIRGHRQRAKKREKKQPEMEATGARERELSEVEEGYRKRADHEGRSERGEETVRDIPIEALLISGDFAAHYDDSEPEKRMAALKLSTEVLFSRFASSASTTGQSYFVSPSSSSSLSPSPSSPSSSSPPSSPSSSSPPSSPSSSSPSPWAFVPSRGSSTLVVSGEELSEKGAERVSAHARERHVKTSEDNEDRKTRLGARRRKGLHGDAEEAGAAPSPTPQMIFVVGNNDLPRDYHVPETLNKWSVALYKLWRPILPPDPETKETFERGLFYRTHLTARPSVRVLCLNTVFYSRFAWEKATEALIRSGQTHEKLDETDLLEGSDPAGQFAWMQKELEDARDNQEQVLLVGHVPPGVSVHFWTLLEHVQQWRDEYLERYRTLVLRYSDVILAHLYGHVHADTVRVIAPAHPSISASSASLSSLDSSLRSASSSAANDPAEHLCERALGVTEQLQPLLTAPAVSPVHGNNPAWRILLFRDAGLKDKTKALSPPTFSLVDYTQLYLPLYGFIPAPVSRTSPSRLPALAPLPLRASPALSAESSARQAEDGRSLALSFQEEYTFSSTYGLPCISGPALARLIRLFAVSPFLFGLYSWHAESGGKEVTNRLRVCEGVVNTRLEYLRCLHGGARL